MYLNVNHRSKFMYVNQTVFALSLYIDIHTTLLLIV